MTMFEPSLASSFENSQMTIQKDQAINIKQNEWYNSIEQRDREEASPGKAKNKMVNSPMLGERFKGCGSQSKVRKGMLLNNRGLKKLELEESEMSENGELSTSVYENGASLDGSDKRRGAKAFYRTQNFKNGEICEATSLNKVPLSKFTIVQNDRCKLVTNVLQKFKKSEQHRQSSEELLSRADPNAGELTNELA